MFIFLVRKIFFFLCNINPGFLVKNVCQRKPGGGWGVRQMSTPVNKGEGGVKNTQNPVNVVYEQPPSKKSSGAFDVMK